MGVSGVFCALVSMLNKMKAEKVVDVFQSVKRLRMGRPGMVETLVRYVNFTSYTFLNRVHLFPTVFKMIWFVFNIIFRSSTNFCTKLPKRAWNNLRHMRTSVSKGTAVLSHRVIFSIRRDDSN